MKAIRYPLTVFYDASCPMCANEIVALQERDRGARLEIVDCSAPDFDKDVLAGTGITRTELMTRIHARDAHGRWLVALDAIEAAYRAVGLEQAAQFWGSRRMRPLLDPLYRWVARRRQALSRLGAGGLVRRFIGRLASPADESSRSR